MRLMYTGIKTVTFLTGSVGEVKPGDEFDVSDELAPVFLRRGDVTKITTTVKEDKPPVKKRRRRTEEPGQSVVTDGGDPEMNSEENSGVSNDH